MGEVDDHIERLALVDHLEPARHARRSLDRSRDRFQIDAETVTERERRQRIACVVGSGQARVQSQRPSGGLRLQPPGAQRPTAVEQTELGILTATKAKHSSIALGELRSEASAVPVITVEHSEWHRPRRSQEQLAFESGIGSQRAVSCEVVESDIGEHCGVR